MTRSIVLALAVVTGALGCGGGHHGTASGPGSRSDEGGEHGSLASRDEAIELARDAAEAAGYPRAEYEVRDVVHEQAGSAGVWRVELVHVAPTPPGGHCTVSVDASTRATEIRHGE